jgi:3-deoxy-7-phosphoheptulonate synthase
MIDASHANSSKEAGKPGAGVRRHRRPDRGGRHRIVGVMVESHLVAGRQDLVPGKELTYGQSVTDGCIDWDASVKVLEGLAQAVRARRLVEQE